MSSCNVYEAATVSVDGATLVGLALALADAVVHPDVGFDVDRVIVLD